MTVEACNSRLHVFFPVERFVDGVRAVHNYVTVHRCEIVDYCYVQVAEAAGDDEVAFKGFRFHGFLRIVRDSQRPVPNNSENALSVSNYHTLAAAMRRGATEAARPRAGVGAACA